MLDHLGSGIWDWDLFLFFGYLGMLVGDVERADTITKAYSYGIKRSPPFSSCHIRWIL
jgi:hypothetical protein